MLDSHCFLILSYFYRNFKNKKIYQKKSIFNKYFKLQLFCISIYRYGETAIVELFMLLKTFSKFLKTDERIRNFFEIFSFDTLTYFSGI